MQRLFGSWPPAVIPFFLAFAILGCSETELINANEPIRYFCGAENMVSAGDYYIYTDGFGEFNASAGLTQNSDSVFAGNFSCKIDSIDGYGMPLTVTNIKEGEYFEASVWIKNPVGRATIIAGTTGSSNYKLHSSEVNKSLDSAGWTKYYMSFGMEADADTLKFFLFAAGETHYFDNFEILRYKMRPPLPDSLSNQAMKIYIPDSATQILSSFKSQALKQNIISSDLKEYVEGYIIQEFDSIPIEIRLKGDWTDHLENGKTSYRIKTDKAYRGLTTFSIQHPQTRNYMHEWFMHKLCDMEGLLSTSYEFLPVEINGVNQGIYAIEEHFDKQILESRNRREGPIIKIDETGFWALLASEMKDSLEGSYPYYESAMITCFKEGRTEKNPGLFQQFYNAGTLLTLFKNLTPNPEEIFDLELTAKYYALMDLGNIHHALAWHNRRYYYNPVTTKLEIIGFDMIPAIRPFSGPLAELKFEFIRQKGSKELALDFFLFSNPDFREYYTHYLNKFSSVNYLDSIFNVMNDEIKRNENLMQVEFPNYSLDRDFYYQQAAVNREYNLNLDSTWNDFEIKFNAHPFPLLSDPNFPELKSDFILEEISVNAYLTKIDSTHFKVALENFHLADVDVVGYSAKSLGGSMVLLDHAIHLNRFDGISHVSYAEFSTTARPNKIYFTVANKPGVIHSKKIFAWPKPLPTHPRIELNKKFNPDNSFYKIYGDSLIISKGEHVVRELILIPEKYVVIIESGAQIDFQNRGGLILNNSAFFKGTDSEPVVITSSDSSSQGITILNADYVSMTYTKISNMGTLNHDGWNLTGAVTIYEGEISITHTEIFNNTCEDALNIIRGHFTISHLNIHDTYGDAFDADFCTGSITQSEFQHTGNDCIDFSGSVVDISKITIRNSGDKGISSGEKSTLTATDIDIDGALTALASKDGSTLTATNIKAKNCEVGIAMYRKKPEYPASKLILNMVEFSAIKQLALIERGAVLNYNSVNYFGYTVFDIEAMYAKFEK